VPRRASLRAGTAPIEHDTVACLQPGGTRQGPGGEGGQGRSIRALNTRNPKTLNRAGAASRAPETNNETSNAPPCAPHRHPSSPVAVLLIYRGILKWYAYHFFPEKSKYIFLCGKLLLCAKSPFTKRAIGSEGTRVARDLLCGHTEWQIKPFPLFQGAFFPICHTSHDACSKPLESPTS
jgi:hypothetical protein